MEKGNQDGVPFLQFLIYVSNAFKFYNLQILDIYYLVKITTSIGLQNLRDHRTLFLYLILYHRVIQNSLPLEFLMRTDIKSRYAHRN